MSNNKRTIGTFTNSKGNSHEAVVLNARTTEFGTSFYCAYTDRKGVLRREWVSENNFAADQIAPVRKDVLAV